MSVGRICTRSVLVASPDETVLDATRRMREADVGSLVVVDAERHPVGALTDRDVVLRCVAVGKEPAATPVASIMTAPMMCASEATPIEDALERMAGIEARRLAVTDDDDRLVGILSVDDVLELLVEETQSLGRLLARRHPALEG